MKRKKMNKIKNQSASIMERENDRTTTHRSRQDNGRFDAVGEVGTALTRLVAKHNYTSTNKADTDTQ